MAQEVEWEATQEMAEVRETVEIWDRNQNDGNGTGKGSGDGGNMGTPPEKS